MKINAQKFFYVEKKYYICIVITNKQNKNKMESVKINLTQSKVDKLVEQARRNAPTYLPFNGNFTANDERVSAVVETLAAKMNFKNQVRVGNQNLLAANVGLSKSISTFFINKGTHTVFAINEETFKIDLTYNPKYDCIELWWLEINDKGNGFGTEIMNNILDIIDELGEKLYLTPVPFVKSGKYKTNMDYHNRFLKLRDFYLSFDGFQRIANNTPSLIYAAA